MRRVAVVGGGISGLAAAYELELARRAGAAIDWQLYEASDRFGGIIETTRVAIDVDSGEGGSELILEGGPDGWVSEKPWARELAAELGLGGHLVGSNDASSENPRRTYIVLPDASGASTLQPVPYRMRLMVPEDLSTLEGSPLFSDAARAAYAAELVHAASLQATSPFRDERHDESVAAFVERHFGEEVLARLAAPLLAGVFGGDVHRLSVRAVMPQFVEMEREHGSLIAGLQARRRNRALQATFTSLRRGMASLVEALVARLPAERVHLRRPALSIKREGKLLCVRLGTPVAGGRVGKAKKHFHEVLLATSLDATAALTASILPSAAALWPRKASSSVLVNLAWSSGHVALPQGFGFLVPAQPKPRAGGDDETVLLAATFVHQKFPHRAPPGAAVVRAFFGGAAADVLATASEDDISRAAIAQLTEILGPLPEPHHAVVRRWPRSLPQYEVGHLERIAQLEAQVGAVPGLTLLGNSYRGVGLPDLIRDARAAARRLAAAV